MNPISFFKKVVKPSSAQKTNKEWQTPIGCIYPGHPLCFLKKVKDIKVTSIPGMENIHPLCCICPYYKGIINNKEVAQLREDLSRAYGADDLIMYSWWDRLEAQAGFFLAPSNSMVH